MRTWHTPATAWRRWLFLAFPPLEALALTLALAIPASAAPVINVHVPFSEPVFNPCTGGDVMLSGDDHVVAEETFTDSGGFHVDVHANIHLTGTDDQGNAYIGNLMGDSVFNIQVGEEATDTQTIMEISQGPAPNFAAHFALHITANADGTITAIVDHATTTCQG